MPKRNPPPEAPVRTYPSPDISEQVLVEWVTSELADSTPLTPGTPHPNQREYAGFKLGIQRVNQLDHNFTQRIWVTDESSPDAYNYAVKYAFESVTHPIFIRVYRELKTAYAARTKGTALKTIYKLILTLAGSGYTKGDEPTLTFDNSGTGGTGASGHGVVSPTGTISELVIDTGGSGYVSAPTFTLAAPAGGVAATGTAYIQSTGALLVSEEAQLFPQESEFHAQYFNVVRVYETIPGPILYGQELDETFGIALPYTLQETVAGEGLGDQRKEITPINSVRSRTKTTDPDQLALLLDTHILSFPSTANLQLPDVLTLLKALSNASHGDGSYTETGSGAGSGTTWFYSVTFQGTAQGSASIVPELIVEIKRYWARNVPTTNYFFYLPTPVTAAQVLARLAQLVGATINSWPKFIPQAHTILLRGEKKSIEIRGRRHYQASSSSDGSSTSTSLGSGSSSDMSASVKAIRIPPTIHAALTIDVSDFDDEDTFGLSFNLHAGAVAVSIPSTTVAATIEPTSLDATVPAAIPNSGLYLYRGDVSPYKPGIARVAAEIVNFADVA